MVAVLSSFRLGENGGVWRLFVASSSMSPVNLPGLNFLVVYRRNPSVTESSFASLNPVVDEATQKNHEYARNDCGQDDGEV
jgi:hypothetical protein